MRKKWYKVIEKWEIMGNSGKKLRQRDCSEQRDLRARKFHFGRKVFILNWALAGAIERKKCKKLQFPAKGPGTKRPKDQGTTELPDHGTMDYQPISAKKYWLRSVEIT